jgi:peptidoglycan/LPS O-acetylase OafA/YrhL
VNGAVRVGVLRVLLGVVVAVAAAGAATGVAFIVADLSFREDAWDGIGAVFGAATLVGSVLAGVLAVVAAVLAVRRPVVARVIGALLALAALAVAYPFAVDTDWGAWLVPLPLVLLVVAALPDGPAR